MYKIAGKREHNARKSLQKLQTNYTLNKAAFLLRSYCDLCDHTTFSWRGHHGISAHMAFLVRSMGPATAITGDPAALSPRSWGSYHASSKCIVRVRRPQGVSTTFSRRLYIKRINFFRNFQRIIVQSYCTINIWCSISKFWITSDMMMNTKYSDENDVVVVRTPWNRGRVEDPMILPLQM